MSSSWNGSRHLCVQVHRRGFFLFLLTLPVLSPLKQSLRLFKPPNFPGLGSSPTFVETAFLPLHRYRLGGKHADKRPCAGSRSNHFADSAGQLRLLGDSGTGPAAAVSQQHRTRSGQRRKLSAGLIKMDFYVVFKKNHTKLVTVIAHTHKHCRSPGIRLARLQQQ